MLPAVKHDSLSLLLNVFCHIFHIWIWSETALAVLGTSGSVHYIGQCMLFVATG